jgi:osmotically-inducible protein OsmY
MKKYAALLFLLATIGFVAAGCTTAKNTGTAVKEGSEAGARKVGEKAGDVGEAVADKSEDVGNKVEDASITAAVKMKFANDETVSASKIDVDTRDGMVTLTGTVSSQNEADRALELARTVSGVKMVHNNLTISQTPQ